MFKAIANFFKRGEDKALISADENVVKKNLKNIVGRCLCQSR